MLETQRRMKRTKEIIEGDSVVVFTREFIIIEVVSRAEDPTEDEDERDH